MGDLSTIEIYQSQYPSSTITQTQFDALIGVVSVAIETYLDRNLETSTYQEYHDGFVDTVLIAKEYPITKIFGCYKSWNQYAQISITEADKALTFKNDTVNFIIEYVVDLVTEYTYDYSADADITTMITNFAADLTANGVTNTFTVNTRYAGASPKLLKDELNLSSGKPAVLEFVGVDLDSQLNWKQQGERDIILSSRTSDKSDSIYLKYTAGYVLPLLADFGTLPRDIIDVTNRILSDISSYDLDDSINTLIKEERLGNASYKLADSSDARSFVSGVIDLYSKQLDRYRRYDITYMSHY